MKDEAPARTGVQREGGCKQREKVWDTVSQAGQGCPRKARRIA